MVWHQYVWEATTGNEATLSDDENTQDTDPLSFEDWELQYSDVLGMMWNTTRTLLHDAYLFHRGELCDFVAFCYMEHDPLNTRVCFEYEKELAHVWKNIRRIVDTNGLHEEVLRGATFYNFVYFCKHTLRVR